MKEHKLSMVVRGANSQNAAWRAVLGAFARRNPDGLEFILDEVSSLEPPNTTTCPTCGAFGLPVEPPPKPDPFEEWWKIHKTDDFITRYDVNKSGAKLIFDAGWDAAIKWKEGKP